MDTPKITAGAAPPESLSGRNDGTGRDHGSGSLGTSHGTQDRVSAALAIAGRSEATALASLAIQVALYHQLVARCTTLSLEPKLVQPMGALGQALGANPPLPPA